MDDDISAALHQLELEERQFLEEWHREYDIWLGLQEAWYLAIDSDEHWIREHNG